MSRQTDITEIDQKPVSADVDSSRGDLGEEVVRQLRRANKIIALANGKSREIAYVPRFFCEFSPFPHSEPEQPYYVRSNGRSALTIQAHPACGVPYGKIPRVLLAYLVSAAKRDASSTVELGLSQAQLLRGMGMASTGGNIQRLQGQVERLARSMFSIETLGTVGGKQVAQIENVVVAKSAILPRSRDVWHTRLTLDQDFYAMAVQGAVPVSLTALHGLRSSLAIDIYCWLTWRVYTMRRKEIKIPWEALAAQMGAAYKDVRVFAFYFKKYLREIALYYPEVLDGAVTGARYFTLRRVRPHVEPRSR